jgi:hypothetical protein
LGNSALHTAVIFNDYPFVFLLLRKGADPNIFNKASVTPLDVAEILGFHRLTCLLQQYGAISKVYKLNRRLSLDEFEQKRVLESNHACAFMGLTTQLISRLSDRSINEKDNTDGMTFVLRSAIKGHSAQITQLLKHKADPFVKDKVGHDAMFYSSLFGWMNVLNVLVDVQPDPKTYQAVQIPPIFAAAFYGHTKIIEHLIENGHQPSSSDLMIAAWMNHHETLKLFVNQKVPIPQPFYQWLEKGRRFRREHDNHFTFFSRQNVNEDGVIPSVSELEIEVESILLKSSPQKEMGKNQNQIVTSVPTSTALKVSENTRKELAQSETLDPMTPVMVQRIQVPTFRRETTLDDSMEHFHDSSTEEALSHHSELLPMLEEINKIIPKLTPVVGTELDVEFGVLGFMVLNLGQMAKESLTTGFSAFSLRIASHVQSLCNKVGQGKMLSPLLAKVQLCQKDISINDLESFLKVVRVASGVWPPPGATVKMLHGTMALLMKVRQLVRMANLSGHWVVGTIDAEKLKKEHSVKRSGSSYNDYLREANLKKIESLVDDEQTECTLDVAWEKEDEKFFIEMDRLIVQFVQKIKDLKVAAEERNKGMYPSLASSTHSVIDRILEEIGNHPMLQEIPNSSNVVVQDEKMRLKLRELTENCKSKANAFVLCSIVASGVCAPPGSARKMLEASIPCVKSLKEFYLFAKESCKIARQTDKSKASTLELHDLWMKGEKVRYIFQIWESPTNSSINPSSDEDAKKILEERGFLKDDEEGLVFENQQIRGGRLMKLVDYLTSDNGKGNCKILQKTNSCPQEALKRLILYLYSSRRTIQQDISDDASLVYNFGRSIRIISSKVRMILFLIAIQLKYF